MNDNTGEAAITSYAQAPTRTLPVGGTTYAYRELGPTGGIPVVFFVHLAATPLLTGVASIPGSP